VINLFQSLSKLQLTTRINENIKLQRNFRSTRPERRDLLGHICSSRLVYTGIQQWLLTCLMMLVVK